MISKFYFAYSLILCYLRYVSNSKTTLDFDLNQHWTEFKIDFDKNYQNPLEEAKRKLIWENNLKAIVDFNAKAAEGKFTFTLKMNKFGDLTKEEFRKTYLRLRVKQKKTSLKQCFVTKCGTDISQLAKSLDYRTQGYVTPVKDQGNCGSCWAFSAVGSLEGQHFKKTGNLVGLSEQNLVDCSKNGQNSGCNGGYMNAAFDYIRDNDGINTETSYPYEAKDGECRFKRENVGATLTGYVDIPEYDECALTYSLAKEGPVSVAIDAGQTTFQFYSSGVYYDPFCSCSNLNHGVTAVGYGSTTGTFYKEDYYIVKNSWGTGWGDKGYILMSRNRNNNCGIATAASYPLV